MESLTFKDIFVGSNGAIVLVSSIILALIGNLFHKWRRYEKRIDTGEFDWRKWFRENTDDVVVGLITTYLLVRLMNVLADLILKKYGADLPADMDPSDVIVVVSLFIGYYTDDIISKLFKNG